MKTKKCHKLSHILLFRHDKPAKKPSGNDGIGGLFAIAEKSLPLPHGFRTDTDRTLRALGRGHGSAHALRHADATRKEVIIEEGQRDADVCFVAEGSVRTYVMREDKCVIFSFSFEGDPATSTLGTQPGGLSRQTIETMEPATLVRIPRARMDELFAGNAELADWGRRMAEEQLRRHEDYFADYAWRGKREQYGRMLREYPQLLQRIALKDLAAYLFLTPQSLSRIRAGVK